MSLQENFLKRSCWDNNWAIWSEMPDLHRQVLSPLPWDFKGAHSINDVNYSTFLKGKLTSKAAQVIVSHVAQFGEGCFLGWTIRFSVPVNANLISFTTDYTKGIMGRLKFNGVLRTSPVSERGASMGSHWLVKRERSASPESLNNTAP